MNLFKQKLPPCLEGYTRLEKSQNNYGDILEFTNPTKYDVILKSNIKGFFQSKSTNENDCVNIELDYTNTKYTLLRSKGSMAYFKDEDPRLKSIVEFMMIFKNKENYKDIIIIDEDSLYSGLIMKGVGENSLYYKLKENPANTPANTSVVRPNEVPNEVPNVDANAVDANANANVDENVQAGGKKSRRRRSKSKKSKRSKRSKRR